MTEPETAKPSGQTVSLRPPLVLAAVAFVGIAYAIYRAMWSIQIWRLRDAKEGWQDLIHTLQTYSKVFPIIALVAASLLLVVLVGLARRSSGRWRTWAIVAIVGLVVSMLAEGCWWYANMFAPKSDLLGKILGSKWFFSAMSLGRTVGIVVGITCILRKYAGGPLQRRFSAAGPLYAWGAWNVVTVLMRAFADKPLAFRYSNPVTYMLLEMAVWISGFVLVFIALRGNDQSEEFPVSAPPAGNGDDYEYYDRWSPAADGLRLYGDALGWRLAAMVIGYSLLMFALLGKSPGLAKLVMWGLPTAGVITGFAMLMGVFKFSAQPDESPGKSPAMFSAMTMIVMALLDGYALLMVFKFLTADAKSYREMGSGMEALKTAQSTTTWAMGLGFAALVVLLVSMGMVAKYLRRADVVRSLTNAGIYLVVAAGVVLWFRSDPPRIKSVGEAVFLSMIILVIAISALGFYISTVRKVEDAMRGHGGPFVPDLPSARVVNIPPE